ncbi:SusC/RagA family TonB-linked outer membrane protein [Chitinophaga horti]|uniref:SusC/RagA family TonB-linked outer membrane protein n=1 Tax=Chitinophaga horti TaxID=2920382 RepID=A0ABY6J250_9BACT|nr:SusC/RagA family TonB-linked outer membrane protein [Chitinophaga horti]UYQ93658.1 SusC/RagA family TonB-linked outer membrane protein [Chitinophaga horti]
MKHFLLFLTCLQLCIGGMVHGNNTTHPASGQQEGDVVVRGTVTGEKGEALFGVSVHLKGSTKGATTDKDGKYLITLPSTGGVLVFSYMGFIAREENIKTTRVFNVSLKQDPKALNEVVVTALGIKRDEKALGYAATVVKGDQLTEALPSNWTDALSGKVAGLNLVRSNGGPTGSIKIILRGENNLTGNNEALVVVDGVIVSGGGVGGSGRRTAQVGEAAYGTGSDNMPADYGSGLNDINPEDIENITVLKGPGAAALYGQNGANGAIIITTKAGSTKKKGLGITVNSNGSMETVNRWPDLQYEYGQGTGGSSYYSYGASADGNSTSATSSAYGPRFAGQMYFQYDPTIQDPGKERTLWKPYVNSTRKYFQPGKTLTNSISMDGGNDKTSARFSITNVQNSWIMPNTGYKRTTLALSVNSKATDKLTIATKINYTNKNSDNLPGTGYGNQSIMYWYIFWQPNADLNWLRNYWQIGKEKRAIEFPFSSFPENPYAIAYEFLNQSDRDAVTANATATYTFSKELSLQVRASTDLSYERRAQLRPYDAGSRLPKGSYRTQNIFSQEVTADWLLKYAKKLNKDFDISATLGGSAMRNFYNKDEVRADSLTVPGVYNMANSKGPKITLPIVSRFGLNSFYGLFSASYRDYLFVDVTGRQDWNSTLATPQRTDNAGFFYTSANLSFVLSEVTKLPSMFDFAKLRFSASSVGSGGTIPYYTAYGYESPLNFDGYAQNPNLITNPNLKPLRTVTYEVGAAAKFLKGRAGLDVAYYIGTTKDQILTRTLDRSSGWPWAVINTGTVRNKGFELSLNGTPVSTKNFKWNTSVNYSTNRNRIVDLPDSSVVLRTGPIGGGQIVAKVGGSMGDLYGRGYLRAPDGQIVYDPTNGFARLANDVLYLGNTMPKGKIGFSNDFSYRQFRLSMLFDAQWGAVAHSLMHHKLSEQGKTTNTLPGRASGLIGKGVMEDQDGKYVPNTVVATDVDYYYRSHWGIDNAEGNTFSTDFIKFREARIDYTIKPAVLKRTGLQRVTVGVYGRNLFIWSPWPMFDPEFGTISGTDIVQGFEIAQFPSTRTFGFNVIIGL